MDGGGGLSWGRTEGNWGWTEMIRVDGNGVSGGVGIAGAGERWR